MLLFIYTFYETFPKDFVLVSEEKMKDVLFPPSLDLLCMIK